MRARNGYRRLATAQEHRGVARGSEQDVPRDRRVCPQIGSHVEVRTGQESFISPIVWMAVTVRPRAREDYIQDRRPRPVLQELVRGRRPVRASAMMKRDNGPEPHSLLFQTDEGGDLVEWSVARKQNGFVAIARTVNDGERDTALIAILVLGKRSGERTNLLRKDVVAVSGSKPDCLADMLFGDAMDVIE